MSATVWSGSPLSPRRSRSMNASRVIPSLSQDGLDGPLEGAPGVLLGREALAPGLGQAVVFTRRSRRGFDQIGVDVAFGLHAPHQRVDGALTHVDRFGKAAGDLIGVAVAAREQRQDAKVEHAFF